MPSNAQLPQGGVQFEHIPLPYKTIKENKQACTQYGNKSLYTTGLIQGLAQSERLIPYDWEMIARTCLSTWNFYNSDHRGKMKPLSRLKEMQLPILLLILLWNN